MKIRIKFKKWGCMKFVGHLDMMRYFQKAVRRAEIDICYSEGFSPHQIMSFAAPLGVGITSDGEYFDIEVNSTASTKESIEALNNQMVDGVMVTGYVLLPDNAKTAMSIVAAADYTLSFKEGYESPYTYEEDLKPLVYEFDTVSREGNTEFVMRVSTGSNDNIKPEFVLESIYNKCGLSYNPSAIQIHRNEVYASDDKGEFVSLLDMGTEIDN